MQDLYGTIPPQEICVASSLADQTASTRQYELDHADHTVHTFI